MRPPRAPATEKSRYFLIRRFLQKARWGETIVGIYLANPTPPAQFAEGFAYVARWASARKTPIAHDHPCLVLRPAGCFWGLYVSFEHHQSRLT